LSRTEIDELLAREDIALREKTLWRTLYETAARASEVLSLDVGDLDLRNRKAKVRRKGGAVDVIVWLSYRRAAECFEAATEGWTLHQLRHSALTRAAEAGVSRHGPVT
jgi:integrase/recombinase XerC/integrase/recombinase XerD